jgi:O-antigen ligase
VQTQTSNFKLLFLFLFLFSGHLKSVPVFQSINGILDLTLASGLIIIFISLIKVFSSGRFSIYAHRYFIPNFIFALMALYLVILLSLIAGSLGPEPIKKAIQVILIPTIGITSMFILIKSIEDVRRILIYIFLFGLAYSFYILYNLSNNIFEFNSESYHSIGRAIFFTATILFVLFFEKIGKINRSLVFFALVVVLYVLLNTGARQGVLGIIASIFFIYFMYSKHSNITKLVFLVFFSALLLFIIEHAVLTNGDYRAVSRILVALSALGEFDIISLLENSNRLALYKDSFALFKDFPFLGIGFGDYRIYAETEQYRHSHNFILEVLTELGFLGLTVYSLLVIPIFKILFNKRYLLSFPVEVRILSAIIVGYFAMMLTSGDMGTNRMIFIFMALFLIALNYSPHKRKSNTIKSKEFLNGR